MRARFQLFTTIAILAAGLSRADAAPPRIGYLYPAGGRIGDTFQVEVGGQYLDDPLGVVVGGDGIHVEILEHNKLPSAQVVSDYRDRFRELQPKIRNLKSAAEPPTADEIASLLASAELDEKKLRLMDEYERRRNDPKRQLNSQIGEDVQVRVTIAENAEPGVHYWRLQTKSGLSNPMRFVVGEHAEFNEPEPWRFDLMKFIGLDSNSSSDSRRDQGSSLVTLPATVNGRILPGEVDEFTFEATEGEQVVISVEARHLIPYLADAVPGWFQAVVSLHDPRGQELAFADDYRFDPDPVLFYKIPRTGEYRLRVRDSIYRGREDFIYRVTIGELPFLTGISPLGARAGTEVDLTFHGGNLDEQTKTRHPVPDTAGL
ncbi:MAG: hypothetical protein KDM63_18865, partial [Verrucomicrobiae bacterium]|nr:hypothetical protein [Verrucomicrobiae bacterium]